MHIRIRANATACDPCLEDGTTDTARANHDTIESKEMEWKPTVVRDKVEESDCPKLVPSVNTSYETCILSNVTAGPLSSPMEMEDTKDCK